ncbi:hypothetical protein DYB28_002258 [Aphanomyces astaci]|nr:hypothetical protein DYB36_001437 [Aphanomyces astaci]RHY37433.1 hypothetical protein DYB25_001376 [Aphanomyces astaci]RHY74077.1 hypothetical protein DYB38_001167 [Aphanomyces astaci]RLN99928.1 hypothetical protein DYB28_002258 [Aphanomyces astaci]
MPGQAAVTPKKRNPCNCKKSQCLKLYCECFASGSICDENCKCVGCHNIPKFDIQRKEAIAITLERNPNAFKPKINTTTMPSNHDRQPRAAEAHVKRKLVVYPLFGPSNPPLQKDVAVHILQHLDGPDLYNASIVNQLWNGMTMSTDIWDYSQLDKVP